MDTWDVLIADCEGVAQLVDPDCIPVALFDPPPKGSP
jgi:hypothetical protein